MLLGEFLERVPECTEADYNDANALYTALPDMDKDDFCMLYRVEVLLDIALFDGLRESLEEYEAWVSKKPFFVKSVQGFHSLECARKMQNGLERKLNQLRGVFNGKEAC